MGLDSHVRKALDLFSGVLSLLVYVYRSIGDQEIVNLKKLTYKLKAV